MKLNKLSRRKFFGAVGLTFAGAPLAGAVDARWIEPTWLKVRRVRIGQDKPSHRFVHFTDLHHKGDRDYLQTVVGTINSLNPEFVCFTGDIVEDKKFLPEALEGFSGIKSPVFGVPGNHDYWSEISFVPVRKCLEATGGAWLLNTARTIADGKINLIGLTCLSLAQPVPPSNPQAKNILLMHYPAWMKRHAGRKFDLMLAGHSHGGQVRIPFYGAIMLPSGVDQYDMGLFQTQSGPLYVNPGIGYIGDNDFRFNCRPEITVIEV
ncbi:MAG TPA: metallophosphoesterase [Verrucomicrobiae bacterium]|nr:metallophosphoesterase [Verrucomicrobiae bacterium]